MEGRKKGRTKRGVLKTYINLVHATFILYKSQQRFHAAQKTCSATSLQNESVLGHKHAALTAKTTHQELLFVFMLHEF